MVSSGVFTRSHRDTLRMRPNFAFCLSLPNCVWVSVSVSVSVRVSVSVSVSVRVRVSDIVSVRFRERLALW